MMAVILWWATHFGRAGSRFAHSESETVLLCNDASNWLGANLKSALQPFGGIKRAIEYKNIVLAG